MSKALKFIAVAATVLGTSSAAQTHGGTAHNDWEGPYLSLGLSYTQGSFSASWGYSPAKATGVGLSLIAGYNFQYDNYVFGPELMANIDNVRGSSSSCGIASSCSSSAKNYLAARLRAGYATDDALYFATVGYVTDEQDQTVEGRTFSSRRHDGLSLGVGAEMPLRENLNLRGEVEYYRFDKKTYDLGSFGSTSIRPSFTAARVGLSLQF